MCSLLIGMCESWTFFHWGGGVQGIYMFDGRGEGGPGPIFVNFNMLTYKIWNFQGVWVQTPPTTPIDLRMNGIKLKLIIKNFIVHFYDKVTDPVKLLKNQPPLFFYVHVDCRHQFLDEYNGRIPSKTTITCAFYNYI